MLRKRWAIHSLVVVSLLASLLNYLTPYDVVITIGLPVRVSPSAGAVWYLANVTFKLTKLQPYAEDPIKPKWLRSEYDRNPLEPFYFDLRVGLTGDSRNYTYVFKHVSFDKSGEYYVQLSHQFTGVPHGKYCLIIEYPRYFKAGVVDPANWVISVVFF